MLCRGQEGSFCAIHYTLEVFFVTRDDNNTCHKLNRPVASKEILILGQAKGDATSQLARPSPSNKSAAREEEYRLFSLLCFPRGRIRVRGEILPQASARLGDQSLCLNIDVWNESGNSEIDEIVVKVRENIRWQVGIKSSMPRKEKVNRVVTKNTITHRQLTKARNQSKIHVCAEAGKDAKDSAGKESQTRCRPRRIKIDLPIPYDARCSYPNGTLLTVEHVLCIRIQLRGCSFLSSQPELRMPLTLQPPLNHGALIAQMNKKRPRMVRSTIYGHDMGEKFVGENPLFDRSYLYRTYYEGGSGDDEWSHLASSWRPDYVGEALELDLASSGKVGGEEDISMF